MIKLTDLLDKIESNERVKIIGQEMYSGICGNVEELESALNDSILRNYVLNVTYDDAVICIYVQPGNPDVGLEDSDDDVNGWCWHDAQKEFPAETGAYYTLFEKKDCHAQFYGIKSYSITYRGGQWEPDIVVKYWCELPKYTPKERKA